MLNYNIINIFQLMINIIKKYIYINKNNNSYIGLYSKIDERTNDISDNVIELC